MKKPANPLETMISKFSNLLGVIDGKLKSKLDKTGGTIDYLTVTNRLSATADHAHALKVARLFSLTGDSQGQISFDGSGDVEISVTVPELVNKADKSVTYTKSEVDQLLQNLIGLAPSELDTIYELAAALKDNKDSLGTLVTELAKKVNSEDVYDKNSCDSRYIQKNELDRTNQALDSLVSQLTAAFENGTESIKKV